MNRTVRWIGVGWVFALCFGAVGTLAQQPASAEPQAPSATLQAPRELVPPLPVPRLVKFAGSFKDEQGKARTGLVGVTFAVYKEAEGGAALWLETQNVPLDEQGRYTVLLGSSKSEGLPLELFATGEPRWLGAQVQLPGEAEQPRVLLVSVPYALKAADADTLGGKPLSAFVTTSQAAGGSSSSSASGKRSASAGVAVPAVSGTGNMNMVAKWVDNAGTLGNSTITDDGTNVNMTGNAGALTYKFTGNAPPPTDPTATIFNQAFVGPVFSGLSFKVRTGLLAPGDALSIDTNRNVSMTGNASALTYKFTGNAALPTDATATILNAANIGPVFSGFSFRVRTGSPPADALTVDPNQRVGIGTTAPSQRLEVGGNIKLSGSGNAIIFSDGTMMSTATAGTGGGTITGVNAGTGLTGGGTSGGVTLGINPAVVPQLGATSNTFTGSLVASSFSGSGTGLTNVNAAMLNGLTSGGFAQLSASNSFIGNQAISGNLALTGTANVIALGGTFDGPNGGVFGRDTINDGTNRTGVQGVSASTGGAGVAGTSTAMTGQAAGVRGFAASIGGAGVFGQATNSTGVTAGVRGVASSPSGRGVSGDMVAATANTAIAGGSGVAGTYGYNQDGSLNASATGGFGVFGQNTASSGTPQGVRGETTSATGFVIGVAGFTHSTGGIATDGFADATTGNPVGVRGGVNSNGGTGGLFYINNASPLASARLISGQLNGSEKFSVNSNGDIFAAGTINGTLASGTTLSGTYTNALTFNNTSNSFTGSGAGLTNVNAALLNGLASTAFATVGANSFTGTQSITGDVNLTGNLGLPNTTSATVGAITLGGIPFAHNFGPANAFNTFLGGAGNFTMTGAANTVTGNSALSINTTGNNNTASGAFALHFNTTGSSNTASGWQALHENSTGNNNTASGVNALLHNSTADGNTATGWAALISNTSGSDNTASGLGTLAMNTSGSGNTAIGFSAGASTPANANTIGSNNTFIGFQAGQGTPSQLTNATAIGANALVNCSNCMVIGDSTTPIHVGIGTNSPGQPLSVAGVIESTTGGYKFPDGTVQTTAGAGGGGTVTSVGSGLGLTGGPITGSGTLAINPSVVPQLTANSNTFTGSISASSFSGSGSGLTGVNATTATSFTGNLLGEVTGTQGATVVSNAVSPNTANAIVRRDASGNFSAGSVTLSGQLVSTVATGVAPLVVNSVSQVTNLNAQFLGGLPPAAFATLAGGNNFTGNQAITGNLTGNAASFGGAGSFGGLLTQSGGSALPATGTATSSAGSNSSAQEFTASTFNNGTGMAVPQNFTWQAEPVGNNTPSPSGSLNLLFAAGSNTPAETGLKISNTGQLTFAAGQVFPGLVTNVSAGDGSISIGGTASAPTVAVTTGGVSNAKLQNSSVSVTAGAGLTGGGSVALGGITTLSVANGGVTNSMLVNSSITVNAGAGLTGGGGVALGNSLTLNNSGVLSFSGRSGVVTPNLGDYSFSQISGTATTAQLPAASLVRAITYLAGCDSCSLLTTADSQNTIFLNLIGAMTINSVTCFSDAGAPTVNIQLNHGGTLSSILSTDLTCSTTGTTSSSFSVNALNPNDSLNFIMATADGVAKRVTVVIKATVN